MKKINLFKIQMMTIFGMLAAGIACAQTVVYEEDFGTPAGNPKVQDYTGWQNTSAVYTGDGTCDLRTTLASEGYGQASGAGNVMINDTVKWFMISGLNTSGHDNLSLYCGLRKKTTGDNGGGFVVEVSSGTTGWTRLPMEDSLPTGSGTTGWYRVRYLGVPACEDLHIRFSSSVKTDYRLDDVCLVDGEETVLETAALPEVTPAGGTYYGPQNVTIATATPDAVLYYTLDGSDPNEHSSHYLGAIAINTSTTLKVFAAKPGMYGSAVVTEEYVILDTNSLVELPLDLTANSDSGHADITRMPGFRAYRLGTSYADGSAKFESAQAGNATLTAHLDGSPGTLSFDLKGKKGGSSPSAYVDINFLVSESADGQTWTPLTTLSENDISTEKFTHIGALPLHENTRYIRWKLIASTKGNTMLNNIVITKSAGNDSTRILDYNVSDFAIYPNPTRDKVLFNTGKFEVLSMSLYDFSGHELRRWDGHCPASISLGSYKSGTYLLKIETSEGIISRRVVHY